MIVGGGIAGLSAAYHLRKRAQVERLPLRLTIIERESWWGGKIRTLRENGFVVEGGPDAFVTNKPWALELCRQLDLEHRLLPMNPHARRVFVLWRGQLHLLPHGFLTFAPDLKGLLTTDLLSWRGKMRVVLGIALPKPNWGDDVSVGKFLRYYLGNEMTERVIAPLIAGVYGGSVEVLSARSTLPLLWQLAHRYRNLAWASFLRQGIRRWFRSSLVTNANEHALSFFMTLQGGLGELVDALLAQLSDALLLSKRSVVRVREAGQEAQGKWEIWLDDGEKVVADAVIVATPAWEAANLLRPLDEDLARELQAIPHTSAITVSLAFEREQVAHPLNGSGFLVAPNGQPCALCPSPFALHPLSFSLLACTWTSSKFPPRAPEGKVLLRAFVNEGVTMSDEELVASVMSALRPLLGITGEPLRAWVFRWREAMPQYTVGHYRRVERIQQRLAHWHNLVLAGNYLIGIGIPDCIRSGKEAAMKVWQSLWESEKR